MPRTVSNDRTPAVGLVEIVTPRTNATPISAVARLLAASVLPESFSLELAGTGQGRSFLIRAGSTSRRHLEQQLGAAYPQADLRPVPTDRAPSLDPARLAAGEQVASCALVPCAEPFLPLRTFRDVDVNAEHAPQADPILAILGAFARLPDRWRALSQLLLRPAPMNWSRPYQRLALDRPGDPGGPAGVDRGPSGASIAAMVAVAGLLLTIPAVLQWYAVHDWLHLGLLVGGLAAGLPAAVTARKLLAATPPPDPLLVRDKLAHVAFHAQLRLSVFAPLGVPSAELLGRLAQLTAAYGQFSLPTGNGLRARAVHLRGADLGCLRALPARRPGPLAPFPAGGATAILNVQELAGLWHLPLAQADVPLLPRTTARHWVPIPATVAAGCRIGAAMHQGQSIPVALSEELLTRHLLAVAKTRRGKSSLLLRLAQEVMTRSGPAAPALVLVDPHRDLARAALGLVPPQRHADVVYLDVADGDRPVGLNLLDTGLGWDADRAVANGLSVFRHQWDQYWGPRMEDIFRMVLHTLYAANVARCVGDPTGRAEQYTILEIPTLLADPAFRQSVVAEGDDPFIRDWWQTFYDRLLDRRLQMESINPVLTKINRLAASGSSRCLFGQPCSTIAPADWLQAGRLVIVNTAQGIVGDDTAALIGGTLLNLLKLHVQAQAALPPGRRRRVTVLVDECHTMPGADYEAYLGELAKYGANLVLATQTLARLEALDRASDRALRPTLFANQDGLFVFNVSAEDARYLVPELGGEVDVADLVSLGEYRCYARLSASRERLPVFSLRLDPPPAADDHLAAQLASASASRYGRPRAMVDAGRAAMQAHIAAVHQRLFEQEQAARQTAEPPLPPGESGAGRGKQRRRNRQVRDTSAQMTLDAAVADEGASSAGFDGGEEAV